MQENEAKISKTKNNEPESNGRGRTAEQNRNEDVRESHGKQHVESVVLAGTEHLTGLNEKERSSEANDKKGTDIITTTGEVSETDSKECAAGSDIVKQGLELHKEEHVGEVQNVTPMTQPKLEVSSLLVNGTG